MRAHHLIFIASGLIFLLFQGCKDQPASKLPPPNINVTDVVVRDVDLYKEFVGQVYGQVDIPIRSRVSGFLEGIHFQEGRGVYKGDLLYSIDEQPFQAEVARQMSTLAEAKTASLNLAKIQLSYCKMYAPINGVIGKTNARVGEFVGQNPNRILRPGLFARIRAKLYTAENAILVPQRCVNEIQGKFSVYKVGADNIVKFQQIELGTTFGDYWRVTDGLNADDVVVLEGLQQVVPPDVPVGLPSELLVTRPDLIQAEQLFYAETSRIGVAQAMRFPSFSLTGVMGVASRDLTSLVSGDALVYSVGGSMLGPIFNWGKNKRRVEIQKQVAEQASLQYEKAVLNAFREVEDALVDVHTYKREVASRQFQMKAATNAAKLSRARYDGGQTGYLEVLETERSLFQTELNTSRTRREQLSAYTFLYKAVGGGWITVGDEPPLTE